MQLNNDQILQNKYGIEWRIVRCIVQADFFTGEYYNAYVLARVDGKPDDSEIVAEYDLIRWIENGNAKLIQYGSGYEFTSNRLQVAMIHLEVFGVIHQISHYAWNLHCQGKHKTNINKGRTLASKLWLGCWGLLAYRNLLPLWDAYLFKRYCFTETQKGGVLG